jgi:hypothetical protein
VLLIGFLCVGVLGEYVGGVLALIILIGWLTGSLVF